jgi:hypothetical protein
VSHYKLLSYAHGYKIKLFLIVLFSYNSFSSDTEVYSEFYPVPPPYSVATSLPTYDEAEKAKAAAMAAAAAETSQRVRKFIISFDNTAFC